ncbi:hypothetical protein J6590_098454 [Homalodisca vitripennis]|nr:hypothetical protein J6590_098454 [Homalodisca vitripennis]
MTRGLVKSPDKSDVIKVEDTFNDYYVIVGAGLASAVPPVTELVVDDGDFAVDSAFGLVPLTQDDIFWSVTELRGGSAPGIDGIPAKIRWFDQSGLTINVTKTKCMAVALRTGHDPDNLHLRLHTCGGVAGCMSCECVERVSEYKYLGVFFDNRLKWTAHIQYIRRLSVDRVSFDGGKFRDRKGEKKVNGVRE